MNKEQFDQLIVTIEKHPDVIYDALTSDARADVPTASHGTCNVVDALLYIGDQLRRLADATEKVKR